MLYYIYNNDELVGFKYNGNTYHYHKNLFGDVIGIYDSNNIEIVTYEYDSWGAIVNTIDNSNINLSTINPFRYRSYYYDEETKLYYLNSRYYGPEFGRFINVDAYVSTGQGTIGHIMYNYCGNNPIVRSDDLGRFWFRMLIEVLAGYVKVLLGINDNGNINENPDVSYREDNSIYQNCYSYAFKLDKMSNPGTYVGIDFLEKKVHTVEEVASYVMADMKAINKDVRMIKTIDRANGDEYVVALKVSDIPLSSLGGYADYHFAVYLSDGTWADKPGRTPSRKGVIESGVASWNFGEIKDYYNSETIFFAVKE